MKTMYRATEFEIERVRVSKEENGKIYMPCRVHGEIMRHKETAEACYFMSFKNAKRHVKQIAENKLIQALEMAATARRQIDYADSIFKSKASTHQPFQGDRL